MVARSSDTFRGGFTLGAAATAAVLAIAAAWVRQVSLSAANLARALREGITSPIEDEAGPPVSSAGAGAPSAIAAARLEAESWQLRALAAEARSMELERRLAAAERDVLELRSRNVCLQGKLATTSATARYHMLLQELDGEGPSLLSARH